MPRSIRVLATGVRVEEHPDPESWLQDAWRDLGVRATPEERSDLARWRAGDVVFVRTTSFVEFDDGSGPKVWEDTPQGPTPVEVSSSATTALLVIVEAQDQRLNLLADLGISDMRVSRFDFEAAARRIEIAPALRARLTLD
jgi:hypothetical protein